MNDMSAPRQAENDDYDGATYNATFAHNPRITAPMMPVSVQGLDEGFLLGIGEDADDEPEYFVAVSLLPRLAHAIYEHFRDLAGMIAGKVLFEAAKFGEPLVLGDAVFGVEASKSNRPGRGYADVDAYPADPLPAEAEAFGHWQAQDRPFEASALAALVARRVAEIARDGLKGQRQ